MNESPQCRTWPCAIACYARVVLGATSLVGGVLLVATLWLMPVGIIVALAGVALINPDQPCL